ncbi:uncharacterized protein LOC127138445 [Lathyrus oleraceus]|uniref:Uncharacterized protein n=1 Tax=Pisum sativum TaxID=3888 RepID=A0A9D4X9K5_PEA|nr:uncharacterized protein LOC127138445 [Pisum sativum]KAI5414745.1 hypothetical protein KIW84_040276 [Pisum sativum]
MMKKMKAVAVSINPSSDVFMDQRSIMRHRSLLQDYEDLHKETEAMRMKLEAVKQKKLILSAEVRFLRHRYTYLLKHPLPKAQPKQEVIKPQKLKIKEPKITKGRSYNRKESTLRPHTGSKSNSKERVFNGFVEDTRQKTSHVFDLNQNGRSLSKKDGSFHSSSAPVLDLNHKERVHSGKEATKKSVTPFFDLNQISREEEELEGNNQPMWIEEQKKSSTQRGVNEEQHNDIKLSVCRNLGEGSSRAGKRKITWQDQVALRV